MHPQCILLYAQQQLLGLAVGLQVQTQQQSNICKSCSTCAAQNLCHCALQEADLLSESRAGHQVSDGVICLCGTRSPEVDGQTPQVLVLVLQPNMPQPAEQQPTAFQHLIIVIHGQKACHQCQKSVIHGTSS